MTNGVCWGAGGGHWTLWRLQNQVGSGRSDLSQDPAVVTAVMTTALAPLVAEGISGKKWLLEVYLALWATAERFCCISALLSPQRRDICNFGERKETEGNRRKRTWLSSPEFSQRTIQNLWDSLTWGSPLEVYHIPKALLRSKHILPALPPINFVPNYFFFLKVPHTTRTIYGKKSKLHAIVSPAGEQ